MSFMLRSLALAGVIALVLTGCGKGQPAPGSGGPDGQGTDTIAP